MRSFQRLLLFWGRPPCSSLRECHFTERIVQVITYVATYRRGPEVKNHLIFTPFRQLRHSAWQPRSYQWPANDIASITNETEAPKYSSRIYQNSKRYIGLDISFLLSSQLIPQVFNIYCTFGACCSARLNNVLLHTLFLYSCQQY